MNPKRTAIFYNYMDNIGGAEVVGLTLARELKADLYTTNIDRKKISQMGFSDVNIYSIGKVPTIAPFKQQLTLLRFRFFRPQNHYDSFIIAGDWAISASILNKPNLCYVHSPTREIWDLREYKRQNSIPWYKRSIFDLWVKFNQYLNLKYMNEVGSIVSNSENTKTRIANYFKKNATVIHPPTYTKNYSYKTHKGYWLSVNRLVDHKRIDIQLNAFARLPNEKLIIVGSYEKTKQATEHAQNLKSHCPSNVTILSWVDDHELKKLYSECIGVITTAKDEDFGMTAVEAMASGKPIIAPNEGGYKETIVHNKTGFLIDNIDPIKLKDAIIELTPKVYSFKNDCEKKATEYDTTNFIDKIQKCLNQK